ncbi:hypothetical protein VP01_4208g1 [Puccinia sorghi]|uniref:Uncharacterized protein n=1 Tax=Puccinia sorghi TaxID=27349 RepID=A0A0L6USQ6_9BASI|nr:hypothetical protein VP01_4208g1 [Puccinia sorghi]
MHSHCGVWKAAWLEHSACQLQAVDDQVFFFSDGFNNLAGNSFPIYIFPSFKQSPQKSVLTSSTCYQPARASKFLISAPLNHPCNNLETLDILQKVILGIMKADKIKDCILNMAKLWTLSPSLHSILHMATLRTFLNMATLRTLLNMATLRTLLNMATLRTLYFPWPHEGCFFHNVAISSMASSIWTYQESVLNVDILNMDAIFNMAALCTPSLISIPLNQIYHQGKIPKIAGSVQHFHIKKNENMLIYLPQNGEIMCISASTKQERHIKPTSSEEELNRNTLRTESLSFILGNTLLGIFLRYQTKFQPIKHVVSEINCNFFTSIFEILTPSRLSSNLGRLQKPYE